MGCHRALALATPETIHPSFLAIESGVLQLTTYLRDVVCAFAQHSQFNYAIIAGIGTQVKYMLRRYENHERTKISTNGIMK